METKPASLCAHSIINRDVITLSRAYRVSPWPNDCKRESSVARSLFPSRSGEHDTSAGAFQLFSRRGVLFDSMHWTNTHGDRSNTVEYPASRLVFGGKVYVAVEKNPAVAQRAISPGHHRSFTTRFKRTPSPTAISIGPDSPGEFIRPTPSPYKFPIP